VSLLPLDTATSLHAGQHSLAAELRHPCRKRLPSSFNADFGCIILWLANVFRFDEGRRRPNLPLGERSMFDDFDLSLDTYHRRLVERLERIRRSHSMTLRHAETNLVYTVDWEKAIRKYRRIKAIIDSMTMAERENPTLLLDLSRMRRAAQGSGTTEQEVMFFIRSFLIWRRPRDNRPVRELCDSLHQSILAGSCPWCGNEICQGEVVGKTFSAELLRNRLRTRLMRNAKRRYKPE